MSVGDYSFCLYCNGYHHTHFHMPFCSAPGPLPRAQLCPVCNGSGRVTNPEIWDQTRSSKPFPTITCHGCYGRGWVTVN